MTTVQLTRAENVAVLTLARPHRLNAIDDELVEEAHAALDEIEADLSCRVLIITGQGRAFCAGADLRAAADAQPTRYQGAAEVHTRQRRWSALSLRLHEAHVPVIAAVNGPAVGGGFALAMAADIRVIAESGYFAAAHVTIGLTGGEMGLGWLLHRAVGSGLTSELLLTGRRIGAAEARDRGLVARVVPDGAAIDAARATASLITANPRFGVALTKDLLRVSPQEATLRQALLVEDRSQTLSALHGDVDDAAAAFRNRTKRPAG